MLFEVSLTDSSSSGPEISPPACTTRRFESPMTVGYSRHEKRALSGKKKTASNIFASAIF